MEKTMYKRNCPKCNKELTTTNKHYYNKAVEKNSPCLSCSMKGRVMSEEQKEKLRGKRPHMEGENNPFYGKQHTDESKHKISKSVSERYKDPELRRKVSEIRKEWHKYNENSFKGKTHSDETKELLSFLATKRFENEEERKIISDSLKEWYKYNDNPRKGCTTSDDTKKKMSESKLQRFQNIQHPWVGRHHTDESKEKMRLINIERVKKLGLPFHPSYNPNSIPIIESFAKENGYQIRHAENGGEYQVPDTAFFVDGYDEKNNVVIEYDEVRHTKGNNKHIDKWRQDIIGNLLKCKFIRIAENGRVETFDYSE